MSQEENAMYQEENAMSQVENAMSCAARRPQLTLPAVSSATSALPEPCLPPNPIRLLVFPYFLKVKIPTIPRFLVSPYFHFEKWKCQSFQDFLSILFSNFEKRKYHLFLDFWSFLIFNFWKVKVPPIPILLVFPYLLNLKSESTTCSQTFGLSLFSFYKHWIAKNCPSEVSWQSQL